MDFKAVSARRYETLVMAKPSSPNGYFIFEDFMSGRNRIRELALHGINPRHVRKLERGDTSAMDRYTAADPDRPGFVNFVKCQPHTPDPLAPSRGTIGVRGVQEVSLDEANPDAHHAVGQWWAQRLLNPVVDVGNGEIVRPDIPEETRSMLAERAGDFALILAGLSRSRDMAHISIDYHPDRTLSLAAEMAGVPAPVALKSYTEITDGVVMAREGRSGERVQIWPPAAEATVNS